MTIGTYQTKPPLITGACTAWFRAQNTALGAVASWRNESRIGSAIQLTGANQPINTASAIGTKNAFVFDGTNDFLSAPSTDSINNIWENGGTVAMVLNADEFTATPKFPLYKLSGTAGWAIGFLDTVRFYFRIRSDSGVNGQWNSNNTLLQPNTNYVLIITYNGSSYLNDPVFYVNSLTPYNPTNSSRWGAGQIAADDSSLNFSVSPGNINSYKGKLAEIAIWKKVLSTDEIEYVIRSLTGFYGVELT